MIMNAKELPGLIWTWVNDPTYSHGGWGLNSKLKNTPYIRADLYETLAKERDELQAEAERLRKATRMARARTTDSAVAYALDTALQRKGEKE